MPSPSRTSGRARTYGQHCALARALDRVGDRWTLLIVRELLLGPARFTELQHGLPGIATNLLTQRLRDLEDHGVVRRTPADPSTGAAGYELTEIGRQLEAPVFALVRWGRHWMLRGGEGDHFRAPWLLLALRALTETARPPLPALTAAVHTGGATLGLHSSEDRVVVREGRPARADLTIAGEPDALLGLFAGALTPERAAEHASLDIRGSTRKLRSLLDRIEL